MEQPLVSILLLSMNHAPYIVKCIKSLQEQTYEHIEIVYLDNASTDDSYRIGVNALKESGIPHKTFRNESSVGISKNVNFLFGHSTGKYFITLSTDDWLTSDSVKEKAGYLEQYPEYGLVYSSAYAFDYTTGTKKIIPKKNKFKEGWVLKDVLKSNFINTIGCMVQRSAIETVGLYDEASPIEDWDMWIRIAEKFPIGLINKELAYYGINTGQNVTGNGSFMNAGFVYLLNKYKHYDEIKDAKKLVEEAQAYHYATREPSFKSFLFILKHFRFNTFFFKQLIKTCIGMIRNVFTKTK